MIRRDALAIAMVCVLFLSAVPFVNADDSVAVPVGEDCDGILIYEVATKYGPGNKDGISLKNYGDSPVPLKGYYLVDYDTKTDAHTFTITANITLQPDDVVTFVDTDDGSWFCEETPDRKVYEYKSAGTKGKSFIFSNSGDYVHLYSSSGDYLDTLVYGKSSIPSKGWDGPAVDLGFTGEAVRRVEPTDTNTYFDWVAASEEYTSNSFYGVPTFENAEVTPFVFPDNAARPIFDTIMGATSSVDISIYMLNSNYMVSELACLAKKGVEVNLLLENKPLGYYPAHKLLKLLIEEGGPNVNVRFIGMENDFGADRYSYVHNKYAIIDNDTVIVTSENWTEGNLGNGTGNRGWGAVVKHAGYALYMKSYFTNDFYGSDVGTIENYKPPKDDKESQKEYVLYTQSQINSFVDGLTAPSKTFTADIKMYMSPDNTFKALQYYIDNANERVYTEQMDLGASYYKADEKSLSGKFANVSPMTSMINAANRGVDARFLLAKSCDRLSAVDDLNKMTNVKAGKISNKGYSTMHNKGVVIDDAVWVSSVNWTDNSFMNNRECGLYIMSKDVADFYAKAYMVDWNNNYELADTLTVRPEYTSDVSVKLTVTKDVGSCTWTVYYKDGSEKKVDTQNGELVIDDMTEIYNVRVVTDGNEYGRYVFGGSIETVDKIDIPPAAAAAGGIGLLALIIGIIKFLRSRK